MPTKMDTRMERVISMVVIWGAAISSDGFLIDLVEQGFLVVMSLFRKVYMQNPIGCSMRI